MICHAQTSAGQLRRVRHRHSPVPDNGNEARSGPLQTHYEVFVDGVWYRLYFVLNHGVARHFVVRRQGTLTIHISERSEKEKS